MILRCLADGMTMLSTPCRTSLEMPKTHNTTRNLRFIRANYRAKTSPFSAPRRLHLRQSATTRQNLSCSRRQCICDQRFAQRRRHRRHNVVRSLNRRAAAPRHHGLPHQSRSTRIGKSKSATARLAIRKARNGRDGELPNPASILECYIAPETDTSSPHPHIPTAGMRRGDCGGNHGASKGAKTELSARREWNRRI